MQLDAEQLRSAPCSYAAAQLNLAQCNIFSKKKKFVENNNVRVL